MDAHEDIVRIDYLERRENIGEAAQRDRLAGFPGLNSAGIRTIHPPTWRSGSPSILVRHGPIPRFTAWAVVGEGLSFAAMRDEKHVGLEGPGTAWRSTFDFRGRRVVVVVERTESCLLAITLWPKDS